MTSTSVEAILTEGLATIVGAATAPGVHWFVKRMPDSPDRALVFTTYRTGRHPVTRLDQYALQVRYRGARGDALDVDELAAPVAEYLASIEHLDVGSVHIDQVQFRSSMPMGVDEQQRWERSDTFDLDITPPATATRTV